MAAPKTAAARWREGPWPHNFTLISLHSSVNVKGMPLLLAVFLAFPAFADDTQVQAMVAPGQVSQGPSAGLSAAQGRVPVGRPGAPPRR